MVSLPLGDDGSDDDYCFRYQSFTAELTAVYLKWILNIKTLRRQLTIDCTTQALLELQS